MEINFWIKRNDRLPEITATLEDAAGVAIDLTGATVKFLLRSASGGTVKVDAAAVIDNAAAGTVHYAWAAADTDTAGIYVGEWQATFADARVLSFPNDRQLVIAVVEDVAAKTVVYCAIDEIRQLANAKSGSEDALLGFALSAAEATIELLTKRAYSGTTATKYYRRSALSADGRTLDLGDDLLTVTTLTNGDGVVLAAGSYDLEPLNATPKRRIRLKSAYSWNFADTDATIAVAGSWGYAAAPPENVKQACRLLALRLYRRKDAPLGVTGSPDLAMAIEIARKDPDVMMLLPGRRLEFV